MTQLPTNRTSADSIADHVADHNTLATEHNELDGHAAATATVHGITDTSALVVTSDSRLSDARTPAAHHTAHEPGGGDGMAVDAAAGTGSLRTLGTGATQAAGGTHAHSGTSVSFTPTGGIAATDVSGALAELDTEKETAGVAIPKSLVDAKGDLLAATANDTVARLAVGTDGQVLTADTASTPGIKWATASGGGNAIFGDGSDGVIDFDGTTTRLGMAPSSGVYTLTRDIFLAGGSQVSGTAVVKTVGFRIFCSGTFTIGATATVHNNGNNAVTSTAGAAHSAATFGGVNAAGGNGTSSGFGSNGGTVSSATAGGAGGAGGTPNAGNAGTATAPPAANGSYRSLPWAVNGAVFAGTTSLAIRGGGGGGGGGSNSGTSGGGGAGGGLLLVCAKAIVNSGTISANGGNGAAASGSDAGGGGAGGGGAVFLIYNTFSGNAATAAAGGRGAGAGTGSQGGAGGTGNIVTLVNA